MGKIYDAFDERLLEFIRAQHVFFVATAPSGDGGHVNLSPKGGGLHVLGPRTVAYADFVGSGVETIAHIRQNGRITFLFCAFEGPPKILRLHGHGRVVGRGDDEYERHRSLLPPRGAVRSLIVAEIERIADSCGFAVPLYDYQGERTQLEAWAERKGEEGVVAYQREKNARSIDDLPGLPWLERPEPSAE